MAENHLITACQQERAIGQLQATTEHIQDTLERLSVVLERIAAQGEQIKVLTSGQNNMFERMRKLEVQMEGQTVRVSLIMVAASGLTGAVTAYVVKLIGD